MEYKHWDALATIFNKYEILKNFEGAEIGTKHGSCAFQLLKLFPKLKLYCIDPYEPYHDDKGKKITAATQSERLGVALNHLRPYLDKGRVQLIRRYSVEAANLFPKRSLDFVFIDAKHTYEAVKEDISSWEPIIREGGLISGHDYEMPEIRKAVDGYAAEANKWIEYRPGLAQVWAIRV